MSQRSYDLDTEEGMQNAVFWTQGLFASMREGAVWTIPRSNTSVKVHHTTKSVTIKDGTDREDGVRKVIEKMGWTINEGEEK